jgi:hypothetical protein
LKADLQSKTQSLILERIEAKSISQDLKDARGRIARVTQEVTQMKEELIRKEQKLVEQSLLLSNQDSTVRQFKQGQKT